MTYGKTVAEAEVDLRISAEHIVGFVDGLLKQDVLPPRAVEAAKEILWRYHQCTFALHHAHTVERNKALRVPLPEFCRHPDKCAGLGVCPRDPICCD